MTKLKPQFRDLIVAVLTAALAWFAGWYSTSMAFVASILSQW
jgi:hypothetical protein